MIVETIQATPLAIPLVTAFKHASAERATTQSLWVEAKGADGISGYGEGCPREYVSNESLKSAIAFVDAHKVEWIERIGSVETLHDWTVEHRESIDRNPAAWSAVELALLDLLGKLQSRSVESLLGLPELAGSFRYTAVIGDGSSAQFATQLATYVKAGFESFKVKLAGDGLRDREKVAALRAAGLSPAQVRADANNLWSDAETAMRDLEALDYPFHALEEPLRAGDFDGMKRLAAATNAKIILDESLLRRDQLDRAAELHDHCVVNLRVSKMGGLLRSLELVRQLRHFGLPVVVGAHVGETSMLTRAALTIADNARDLLLAQEGAFGTHLLDHDVVEPPIMFGAGGVLDAEGLQLTASGFGLRIERR